MTRYSRIRDRQDTPGTFAAGRFSSSFLETEQRGKRLSYRASIGFWSLCNCRQSRQFVTFPREKTRLIFLVRSMNSRRASEACSPVSATKIVHSDKNLKAAFKEAESLCALNDFQVVDTELSQEQFKIRARKRYKRSARFRWGFSFFLLFCGFLLPVIFRWEEADYKASPFLSLAVFIPVLVYVIHYFVFKARERRIGFTLSGVTDPTDTSHTDLAAKISDETNDLDEANSQINGLLGRLV